jgi:hypothetical protein
MGEANRRRRKFRVDFVDRNVPPMGVPDPAYPDGIDLDTTRGAPVQSCKLMLPYPSGKCGMLVVYCMFCGSRVTVSTVGRRDDPRSVRLTCLPQEVET